MIPAFPRFKELELSDRGTVLQYTVRFPPYTDFSFASLWAWDTNDRRKISDLNGNLVVLFTDYSTQAPFLSFLGDRLAEETALELLRYAPTAGLPPQLRLVPSVAVEAMHSSALDIQEDRDSHDYIFAVKDIATYRGNKLSKKRHRAAKYHREHPGARTDFLRLGEPGLLTHMRDMMDRWESHKLAEHKNVEFTHERMALERLFRTAGSHDLLIGALFDGDVMHGFTIEDIVPGYSTGQFSKADTSQPGAYEFLAQQTAVQLETLGVQLCNWEQDLGDEAMRRSKLSYRPISFLKKYTVGHRHA